ncbi:hypothetical protein ABW19_dt0208236 [Dactylella cylindrospora]|nr:hypothetical protein ABW19_dt0208236 [Dactylella cylindrospora]
MSSWASLVVLDQCDSHNLQQANYNIINAEYCFFIGCPGSSSFLLVRQDG